LSSWFNILKAASIPNIKEASRGFQGSTVALPHSFAFTYSLALQYCSLLCFSRSQHPKALPPFYPRITNKLAEKADRLYALEILLGETRRGESVCRDIMQLQEGEFRGVQNLLLQFWSYNRNEFSPYLNE